MMMELGSIDYWRTGRLFPVSLELRIGKTDRRLRDWDTLTPIPAGAATLSISADIWLPRRRDTVAGGQLIGEIQRWFGDRPDVARICQIWEQYHLNDMEAGTKAQTEFLRSLGPYLGYDWACGELQGAGLLVDRGYRYGSSWLYQPIPAEVLAEIKALFSDVA